MTRTASMDAATAARVRVIIIGVVAGIIAKFIMPGRNEPCSTLSAPWSARW